MNQIRYVSTEPRPFRLVRSGQKVVETTLIGVSRFVAEPPDRGQVSDFRVRLEESGEEVSVGELMRRWDETVLGTPDWV